MLPLKVKNARKIPRYWPRNVGKSPILELLTQASNVEFLKCHIRKARTRFMYKHFFRDCAIDCYQTMNIQYPIVNVQLWSEKCENFEWN